MVLFLRTMDRQNCFGSGIAASSAGNLVNLAPAQLEHATKAAFCSGL
jgi:hypothetical protein